MPRAWRFHATGQPARGRRLSNPRRDTSRRGLARAKTFRFAGGRLGVRDFSVHCSPARLRVGGARPFTLVLHSVDGLRQQPRSYGLDDVPREYYGDIEVPARSLGRRFVKDKLGGRRFTDVTLQVTSGELRIPELGWTFRRRR